MPKPCAIPLLNLPVKSTYSSSTVSKPKESAFKITEKTNIEAATPTIPSACYKFYEEFVKWVLNLNLSNLAYSLNSYNICQGTPDNLSIDYSLLVKNSVPKVFIPFQEKKYPCMNLFLLIKWRHYTDKNFSVKNKRSYYKGIINQQSEKQIHWQSL